MTMPYAKDRTYKGNLIRECESAQRGAYSHRGRWIVQAYHETGTALTDELCAHYQTIAAAKESIDQDAA